MFVSPLWHFHVLKAIVACVCAALSALHTIHSAQKVNNVNFRQKAFSFIYSRNSNVFELKVCCSVLESFRMTILRFSHAFVFLLVSTWMKERSELRAAPTFAHSSLVVFIGETFLRCMQNIVCCSLSLLSSFSQQFCAFRSSYKLPQFAPIPLSKAQLSHAQNEFAGV